MNASHDPESGSSALLKFQIGPVQDFIAQARSTRDFWSGSFLLSWLVAAGIRELGRQLAKGSLIPSECFAKARESLIFPAVEAQPRSEEQTSRGIQERVDLSATQLSRCQRSSRGVWFASRPAGHSRCSRLGHREVSGRSSADLSVRCLRRRSHESVDGSTSSGAFLRRLRLGRNHGPDKMV